MAREPLSPRQRQYLAFIVEYTSNNGWPLSIRDFMANFGQSSTSGVIDVLKIMERKKYIYREPMQPRCIRILEEQVA